MQKPGEALKPLWQLGLDWLREIGCSPHPLDRERVRLLARGMRMLGEYPDRSEVRAYVAQLWPSEPWTAATIRDSWRSVYRAQTSLGRDRHWHCTPLYVPDVLIQRYELRPVTEVASCPWPTVHSLHS